MYTTHGLMTPADRADHDALYDTGRHPHCPGHDSYDSRFPEYCSVNEECPGDGPRCPACDSADFDLERQPDGSFWRCYECGAIWQQGDL
jgi:hypothetical protein